MDQDELRVLGEPQDAPAEVWQAAVTEALSRPSDESFTDFLTWDDSPGLDEGLDTGWDDPAYGNEGWEPGAPVLPDSGTDLTQGGVDGDWVEDQGLADDNDDPFGRDTLDQDAFDPNTESLDPGTGHNDTDTWLDPDVGFDGG